MNKFKENILFELYKDNEIVPSKILRDKLKDKYSKEFITNLIARISKYQVKKYGHTIDSMYNNEIPSKSQKYEYKNFYARLKYRYNLRKEGKYSDK